MDDNSTIEPTSSSGTGKGLSGLAGLGSLLPGVGMASTQAPPLANGHVNARPYARLENRNTSEEEEEEVDTTKIGNDPRAMFRINNVGSSESSGGHSERPIIRVQGEDGANEGSPLFSSRKETEDRRRRKRELADSSMPPIEPPQSLLVATAGNSRDMGSSRGHEEGGYGTFGVTIQEDSDRSRSPSPSRRRIRKTISGKG